jgi:hypothetical protein
MWIFLFQSQVRNIQIFNLQTVWNQELKFIGWLVDAFVITNIYILKSIFASWKTIYKLTQTSFAVVTGYIYFNQWFLVLKYLTQFCNSVLQSLSLSVEFFKLHLFIFQYCFGNSFARFMIKSTIWNV